MTPKSRTFLNRSGQPSAFLTHACAARPRAPAPPTCPLTSGLNAGVLSEEQIRLKKLKRQEEEQAQGSSAPPRTCSPPQALPQLSPEQLGMIEKLVAAQQLCNRRSFSDQLRVTVALGPGGPEAAPGVPRPCLTQTCLVSHPSR